jgi:hypothetical protein
MTGLERETEVGRSDIRRRQSEEFFSHGLTRIASDYARYQLVALATYLPKGYLVAAATYLADSVALTQIAIAK